MIYFVMRPSQACSNFFDTGFTMKNLLQHKPHTPLVLALPCFGVAD